MGVSLSTASPLPDGISLQNFNGSWRIKDKVLIETLTFAGDTSKTSGTLPTGYTFYVIQGFLTHSAGANIGLKLNAVASGDSTFIAATTVGRTATTYFILCNDDTSGSIINAMIQSTSKAAASSPSRIKNNSVGGSADFLGIGGFVTLGNNIHVDSLTINTPSGNLTGSVKIYGVNAGGM